MRIFLNIFFSIPVLSVLIFILFVRCSSPNPSSETALARADSNLQVAEVVIDSSLWKIPSRYLLGRFDPAKDTQFVKLRAPYAGGSALAQYLHQDALAAFLNMRTAAQAEGVSLVILSATRNFYRQKQIWEAKWNGIRKVSGQNLAQTVPDPQERAKVILRYSSMPGTSRHHWGTDIDLNAFENSYFGQGKGKVEYEWLQAHASAYGFCQTYTPKSDSIGRTTGYEEEKWHWSYLPLSEKYLQAYELRITEDSIYGFDGAEAAPPIQVIKNYVSRINPACK